ncbi:membrane protein [Paenibacillus antibioticophila]|uniref:Membrane protein n=1 Tax=Paenibacillus antibioticophila TaxID=1274374 RepID=A0A920CJ19_9BACL|nr:DMT family transporter [Paenibacillus antibioticophila]GIO38919.1 membrane protein [Paenibacillus antibioticophila]
MISLAVLLVLGSGMAHAVWNTLAKQSENKQLFLFMIYVPATLVLLPGFIKEMVAARPPWQGYLLLFLSLLIQAGYAHFLSKSLTYGDLSQVYPMMRGISTFLLPLSGVLLLNERLTGWGWLGLGLIAIGFFLTSGLSLRKHGLDVPRMVLFYTVAVGICTMSYVMVDKVNLQYFSPTLLLEISNIGFMLGLVPSIRFGEVRWGTEFKEHGKLLAAGSILSPGSYLLFLFAMSMSPLIYVAPLREIGTVFGTLIGVLFLKEGKGVLRIVSAGIIFAGILLVGILGL